MMILRSIVKSFTPLEILESVCEEHGMDSLSEAIATLHRSKSESFTSTTTSVGSATQKEEIGDSPNGFRNDQVDQYVMSSIGDKRFRRSRTINETIVKQYLQCIEHNNADFDKLPLDYHTDRHKRYFDATCAIISGKTEGEIKAMGIAVGSDTIRHLQYEITRIDEDMLKGKTQLDFLSNGRSKSIKGKKKKSYYFDRIRYINRAIQMGLKVERVNTGSDKEFADMESRRMLEYASSNPERKYTKQEIDSMFHDQKVEYAKDLLLRYTDRSNKWISEKCGLPIVTVDDEARKTLEMDGLIPVYRSLYTIDSSGNKLYRRARFNGEGQKARLKLAAA